jgi:serine phosphatase RsbU (regulator of sigma subunit)/pSer/pThr/pTyr-binding forkhead associated (FHA) protein
MITLHVVPSRGIPSEHSVTGNELIIGRSSKAGLEIGDRSLSRQHARLYTQDENWMVEDLGSRNGTQVNGRTIEAPTELKVGDVIELGASTIAVREIAYSSSSGSIFRPATEVLEKLQTSASGAEPVDAGMITQLNERLQILNEVHRALGRSAAVEDLLDLILERAFEHLQPEEGAVFLRIPDATYRCAASRSTKGHDQQIMFSTNLMREVADKGMAALVLDARVDARFQDADSMINAGICSLVAAPLLDPDGPLGMMVLSTSANTREFTEEDMELLTSLASVAAMRIREVRLTEEAAERRRLEREVALARDIQIALLPDSPPSLPGYLLHGGNSPSRGVSGDFYTVLERKAGTECVFFVADVSGKGIPAAVIAASLDALMTGPIELGVPPAEACERVSRRLFHKTSPSKFATAFLAVLELASGVVHYTNAGHNPGLVLRGDGTTEWLDSTGPPLGMFVDGEFAAAAVELEGKDTLVLYTDGITEAENLDAEQFGQERLAAVCAEHRDHPPAELARAIEDELVAFADGNPFTDDRTVVILRREG